LAKTSQIARENKRKKLVSKFADKRKQLKDSGDYDALSELPRNSNPIRQVCTYRKSKRILQEVRDLKAYVP
jgi:hypothetical protein